MHKHTHIDPAPSQHFFQNVLLYLSPKAKDPVKPGWKALELKAKINLFFKNYFSQVNRSQKLNPHPHSHSCYERRLMELLLPQNVENSLSILLTQNHHNKM